MSLRFGCWGRMCLMYLSRKLMFRLRLCVLLMMIVLYWCRSWLCWIFVSRSLLVMSWISVFLDEWLLKWIVYLIVLLSGMLSLFVICWVIVCVVSCCGCVWVMLLWMLCFSLSVIFGSCVVLFELVLLVMIMIWLLWIVVSRLFLCLDIGSCGGYVIVGIVVCWCVICVSVCAILVFSCVGLLLCCDSCFLLCSVRFVRWVCSLGFCVVDIFLEDKWLVLCYLIK